MWKIILPPTITLLAAFMIVVFAAMQAGTLMRYGELAYTASDGANIRLYLLDIDHGLGYRLANAPLTGNYFAWSPDGMWLTFVSSIGNSTEVFIAGADGHSLRQLTVNTPPEYSPAWSPDSQQLVFSRQAIDNTESTDLVIMNVETREERILTHSMEIETAPIWSPDGHSIAYIVVSSLGNQIKIIDAQTGDLQTQVNELTGNLNDLSWSPDSTHIMFTASDIRGVIYIMEIASDRIFQLTDGGQYSETPMWSPDGTQIVFVSNPTRNSEVYIIAADGTNQQRISYNQVAIESFPAWSSDSRRIAFEEYISTDIYVINVDGSGLQHFAITSAVMPMLINWRP